MSSSWDERPCPDCGKTVIMEQDTDTCEISGSCSCGWNSEDD